MLFYLEIWSDVPPDSHYPSYFQWLIDQDHESYIMRRHERLIVYLLSRGSWQLATTKNKYFQSWWCDKYICFSFISHSVLHLKRLTQRDNVFGIVVVYVEKVMWTQRTRWHKDNRSIPSGVLCIKVKVSQLRSCSQQMFDIRHSTSPLIIFTFLDTCINQLIVSALTHFHAGSALLCAWLRRLAGGGVVCVFSMILGVRTDWERTSHHTVTGEGRQGRQHTPPCPALIPALPSHTFTHRTIIHMWMYACTHIKPQPISATFKLIDVYGGFDCKEQKLPYVNCGDSFPCSFTQCA